uniref:DUF459 domain-containing protein n=1 Tax=Photorhabdus sp. RM322S TaxID=3342825 RepID=UPI0036DF5B15
MENKNINIETVKRGHAMHIINRVIFMMIFSMLLSPPLWAKTLFLGDSLTPIISQAYQRLSDQSVEAEYQVGSGLHSQRRFDWFEHIAKLDLTPYSEIVIVMGTNDLIEPKDIAPYARKVWQFIHAIRKNNSQARIIWVSPIPLQNSIKNEKLANTSFALHHALNYMGIPYVDLQRPDRLGRQFSFTHKTQAHRLRTEDGIHLTSAGGIYVAQILAIKMNLIIEGFHM